MNPVKNDLGIWMPLYIGDYQADTSRLTAEESGCYLHMQMDYWRNGPLPNDIQELMAIGRLRLPKLPIMISGCVDRCSFNVEDRHAAAYEHYANIVDMLLRQYFTLGADGRWHHSGLDVELAKWTDKKQRASDHGKKAAKTRWGAQPSAMPENMPEQCASPSPSPIQKTTDSNQADFPLFLLRDGNTYEATAEQIAVWQREFPNINVRHALLKMQAMQRANPRYIREI